ncbi:MAG: hypothetical protein QNK03_26515 [Myxococcota bacterium]|nr:hypothetical protein [Myxococcota bacterium]
MASPLPDAAAPTPLSQEQRQVVRLCLSALGVLGTGSLIGVSFSLYLVNHAPLLLVALSPLGRHIVLAVPVSSAAALVAVAVGRRMLFYLASFHLGSALGPSGIPWIEARAARFARFVRFIERLFARAPRVVVLLMTGPTVSAMAGIFGMRAAVFLPLAAIGLTLRVALLVAFGEWMRAPLEVALTWIEDHWVPGTVVMVAVVALYRWRRRTPTSVMED